MMGGSCYICSMLHHGQLDKPGGVQKLREEGRTCQLEAKKLARLAWKYDYEESFGAFSKFS